MSTDAEKKRAKRYAARYPDRVKARRLAYGKKHRERLRAMQWAYRRRTFLMEMVRSAKKRAKAKGLPFDLVAGDLSVPATCPLLGIPIELAIRAAGPGSPTLDRIIPELGYVAGNVWIISHRANSIKRDASVEEIEMLAMNLRTKIGASPWK
jgi:hypothetical protein